MKPCEDPNHDGNSAKYHTGKKCIIAGCDKPAGTAWGPHWCQEHNAERIYRITLSMESIQRSFAQEPNP